jgi:light-regulated signal transduction histidine kinase (bacteriophytochrome)
VFPDNPNDPSATGVANLRASLKRVLQSAATDTMAIQKYDVRGEGDVFEERYWSPINSPVIGVEGNIEYIIHRVEDVTGFVRQKKTPLEHDTMLSTRLEQMEAEVFRSTQEVQAANEQLHEANKELEAFSYSVSHDLRAPLRHIAGFVDLLKRNNGGSLDDRGRRYLSIINNSAGQMGALIDDLLVFSRMSRMELRRTKVASVSLLDEARNTFQNDMNGRHIDWQIAPLPEVEADASMLRQVWINLVGNAVKYTRHRDPAKIEVGCANDGNGEWVFFVRDNGVGFDMKYVDKLFGVFQRLHRADEFEGTGIGLANVRRIVSRHGGRTWARGEINQGATFYFSLPKTNHQPKG